MSLTHPRAADLSLPTPEALERLFHVALAWASRHRKRRGGCAGPVVDYDGAALEALCVAAQRFDPRRGYKFGAYATKCFKLAVIEEERQCDRLGRTRRHQLRDGAPATPADEDMLSLAAFVPESGEDLRYEEILVDRGPGPEAAALSHVFAEALASHLRYLPARERYVVEHYYLDGELLREIAGALGLSEARVYQLRAQALARLRRLLA